MGTPNMLWFAGDKAMFEIIIPKPEVRNGHPLAVGLLSYQHGLKADVKAEVRSTSPEGLGLDIRFGHAIVFKGKKALSYSKRAKTTTYSIYPLKSRMSHISENGKNIVGRDYIHQIPYMVVAGDLLHAE